MDPTRNHETPRAVARSPIRGLELPDVVPVASALAKAVAAARLYPAENPTYLNAKKHFDDAITSALRVRRSLRFVVGRRTLFFGGAPVLREAHGESTVASLHKEGIREIGFHRGLTPEETRDLLRLFTRTPADSQRTTEDLRTLIWDRGFTHITSVSIDDFLELESDTEEIPAEFGRDFARQVDIEVYDLEDEARVDQAAREMSERIAATIATNDVELFGVTDAERAGLLAEIAREEDPLQLRHDFNRILVEVLLAEEDAASFVEIIDVYSKHLAALLDEGNLIDYGWLLGVLVKVRAERADMPAEMSGAVDNAISWIWTDSSREMLRSKLDRGEMDALQGLSALVQAVPDESIRHLCLLLGDLETGRVRRRLIDLLVDRCRQNWTVLLPLLSDTRWYLVRNIVLILGQVGNRLAAPSLQRALEHEDYRVRKEALAVLDRLDPAGASSDLRDALGDPERRVRVFAAQKLAQRGTEAALILLALVQRPDFAGRSESEVLGIFTALAHAGGPGALAFLGRTAEKPRGLFRKGASEVTRTSACRALGRMNDPRAAEILRGLIADKSVSVRESAVRALEELEARATRTPHSPVADGQTEEAA